MCGPWKTGSSLWTSSCFWVTSRTGDHPRRSLQTGRRRGLPRNRRAPQRALASVAARAEPLSRRVPPRGEWGAVPIEPLVSQGPWPPDGGVLPAPTLQLRCLVPTRFPGIWGRKSSAPDTYPGHEFLRCNPDTWSRLWTSLNPKINPKRSRSNISIRSLIRITESLQPGFNSNSRWFV